ncbi:zona pellucida sperm-binding protein 4-like [Engraulis encrasicolus]|uniref:zona pellucida sperm-binding protein 4-like n=1 Tax=Engraulis encrasicolus TaxID=184585 RepID=UPI002FCF3495
MAGCGMRSGSISCSVLGAIILLVTCLASSAWAMRVSQTPKRQPGFQRTSTTNTEAPPPPPHKGAYTITKPRNQLLMLEEDDAALTQTQGQSQAQTQAQAQAQTQAQTQAQAQAQEARGVTTEVAAGEHSLNCTLDPSVSIACGAPDITAAECNTIGCCFLEGQCYYGKKVTVQCTRDGQIVLVVDKGVTEPRLSIDQVSLMEAVEDGCLPIDQGESIIYQFPVTACGTVLNEEEGSLHYSNVMFAYYEVGLGPRGNVTRDSMYELLFECRFSETAVASVQSEMMALPPPAPLVVNGPMRMDMHLGSGQCPHQDCNADEAAFTSFYTAEDYPVTKMIRDPVHVEVRVLDRTDPNLVLQLGNCWATAGPDSESMPQWDLLVDGCPYEDDWYMTQLLPLFDSAGLQFPSHHKRFVMKMFTFIDEDRLPLKQTIYIHCSAAVCYPTASEPCEQSCKRQRRAAPLLHKEVDGPTVSSGEVRIISGKALH